MADRRFNPPGGALEVNVCSIYADIAIGAAGAPTVNSAKGIASVERVSAGQYKFNFEDQYNQLLFFQTMLVEADDEQSVICRIIDAAASNSEPSVTVQFQSSADGADIELSSGNQILCKFDLRNSTVD